MKPDSVYSRPVVSNMKFFPFVSFEDFTSDRITLIHSYICKQRSRVILK